MSTPADGAGSVSTVALVLLQRFDEVRARVRTAGGDATACAALVGWDMPLPIPQDGEAATHALRVAVVAALDARRSTMTPTVHCLMEIGFGAAAAAQIVTALDRVFDRQPAFREPECLHVALRHAVDFSLP